MVEPPQTHSNLPCRPAFPFMSLVRSGSWRFGAVEPPRTHSELPFRPASPFITVVRGSLVWSNHPELTRTFPVDRLPHLSQRFEEVRRDRTAPNSLQRSLKACFPLRHSDSRRFGVFEPPQILSNLPCMAASLFVTVVRGGSVRSNRPKLTRTFPAGVLPPTSQWFKKVRCS